MEIENYPNYLIYRDGRVYTKKHDKFLKPGTFYTGYYYVNLCRDGKPKPHTIHRLIAMHYIPNPQNKEQVDHKNRNRQDNRIENLRWTTISENISLKISNLSGVLVHQFYFPSIQSAVFGCYAYIIYYSSSIPTYSCRLLNR